MSSLTRGYHVMRDPKTDEIKKVALNLWAHHRRMGWEFVSEVELATLNKEAELAIDPVIVQKEVVAKTDTEATKKKKKKTGKK